jgi:hypothetical protein
MPRIILKRSFVTILTLFGYAIFYINNIFQNRTRNHLNIKVVFRGGLVQRFLNWSVASRFVVGREKFLKFDSFNYIKIKDHKKWESEKTKQKIRKW